MRPGHVLRLNYGTKERINGVRARRMSEMPDRHAYVMRCAGGGITSVVVDQQGGVFGVAFPLRASANQRCYAATLTRRGHLLPGRRGCRKAWNLASFLPVVFLHAFPQMAAASVRGKRCKGTNEKSFFLFFFPFPWCYVLYPFQLSSMHLGISIPPFLSHPATRRLAWQ